MPVLCKRSAATPDAEWLVANALGGYASGPVRGPATRRFHALLIATLPAPFGRFAMLDHVVAGVITPEGAVDLTTGSFEFQLGNGLPVWRYRVGDALIEKTIFMPHWQNTVHLVFRVASDDAVTLELRPFLKIRPMNAPVDAPLAAYAVNIAEEHYEISAGANVPILRLKTSPRARFTSDPATERRHFALEARRGYAADGAFWSPGTFLAHVAPGETFALSASTESWQTFGAHHVVDAVEAEQKRRVGTIGRAAPALRHGFAAELVLAADAFVVTPAASRGDELARARASGDDVRSVIAGYHWFTDWGRDTMVSLEGLTLATGRADEAGCILRTFAQYIRDGLIPNLFPEGESEGLYHTADATLWFFHALSRYLAVSDDGGTLEAMLPKLVDIFEHHMRGTRFGIGVDPRDGLLTQGAPGYQLTWMDAKVGDWVVTPRRGKAVEINALWYNALRLLERWLDDADRAPDAQRVRDEADRVYDAFNRRF